MSAGQKSERVAPRIFLALAALLMAIGGYMHAAAFFAKISSQISNVRMTPFLENAFKALWLIDSSTMFCMAVIFGWLAWKPSAATRAVIMMLGLVPLGTGLLLYIYLGNFFAAHMMMATTFCAWIAAAQGKRVELIQ
jgi:hypothetical protein